MGLLEIIEQKLKAEADQFQGKIEKRTAGVKGGMREIKGKINEKIADKRLEQKLDED